HLREALMDILAAPFRRLGRPRLAAADDFWALRDVSFEVQQGEVLGIIGRNGAGKSTALKIISRITPPTAGRVELYGRIGSLLVDEVLAVGDLEFQRKCLGKMDEVARTGRTVLFVSHNMAVMRRLCGRGILLDRGRVVASGTMDTVADLYARPDPEGDAGAR